MQTPDELEDLIGMPVPGESAVFPLGRGGTPAYDAADMESRELLTWAPSVGSADLDLLPEKGILDTRVRDASRNDAYVQNGGRVLQDAIVGERFLLNSKPNFKVLGLDEVWAEEFQEEVEAKFTLFGESDRCYFDASRHNTFTGLVRLAVGIYGLAGEVLATAEWIRGAFRPYSTAIQMVDLDRLSNPLGEMDSRWLRRGVQRDQWGAPIGYHIRMSHPSDALENDNWTWKYVPATRGQVMNIPGWDRAQVIHIIEQDRPDQSRGVSSIVAALKETRMGKRFRDTVLQSAVLNASYAASIESDLPTEVIAAQVGAGGDSGKALSKYAIDYLKQVNRFVGSSRNIGLGNAKIPVFYPGTKMKLQPAGTPGGVGTDFEKSLLRYLAASFGVTYEQLSKDYAQANYSNLRAAIADAGRTNRVKKRMVADRFANAIFRLWLEEAISKGDITSMPRNAPNWYTGLNAEAYCQAEWIGATMGQIDELKETQAAVLRINNGLSTREDELARLGKDWRQLFPQLAREKALAKKNGLEFASDSQQNQMNASSGTPTDEGKNPEGEGDK